jgi:ABC-type sugar transport system substrate-binding protein
MIQPEDIMKKPSFLISLTTDANDYQQEQAAAATRAAQRLGVDIQILYAENDAITQSQQLLKVIQSSTGPRPDAIILEPAGGTALPQVARAAMAAGMGWVVLNRDAEYIEELRRMQKAPVFCLTSDHEEIGRIQGRQFAVLLPNGGTVLYIQGPTESLAAKQRTAGMYETKPERIQIKLMKAHWTEESAYKAVASWLRLATSQDAVIDLVGAQDDSMAAGARRALQDHTTGAARDRWLKLPFTGCDGLPKTGQAWVHTKVLTATIIVPANAPQAMEMVVHALRGGPMPRERSLTVPNSYPPIEFLAAAQKGKSQAMGI